MHKSEFRRKSYGHPKLALLIRRGGAKFGHTPVFYSAQICSFRDAVLGLDGLGNSYTLSMTFPQQKTDYTMK